jgi:hypothetical protein
MTALERRAEAHDLWVWRFDVCLEVDERKPDIAFIPR